MDKRVASYIKEEYTKVELLKKTEHSSIWLAKDGTGQIVVVKQLSTTGLPFRKLKEIAHQLWPRILFTAEEDDTTWVVEEYFSGNTLSAEIETGRRFSPAEVKTSCFSFWKACPPSIRQESSIVTSSPPTSSCKGSDRLCQSCYFLKKIVNLG